jgi:transglutaminase-like putative cysteine protease
MCRRLALSTLSLAFLVPLALTQPPNGKVLKEVWEAAYLDGNQAGHVRGLYRELNMGGMKVIEASSEFELTVVRFGQSHQIQFTMANHETTDGKVLAIVMQENTAKGQKIVRRAKVDGKHIVVSTDIGGNTTPERKQPWNDQAIGLYGEELLFRDRKIEPGLQFSFLKFEPSLDSMINYHVELKDWEEVPLLKNAKKRLMRVETRMDKIQDIQLPTVTSWIDDKGDTIKRQMQLPGLGQLVTYRATREQALAKGGKVTDIGISQLIRLNQAILRPMDAKEATYRVRLKEVEEPLKAFASDERQKVTQGQGDALDIHVLGRHTPSQTKSEAKAPEEYLKSNHFLCSDDAKVKSLAAEAAGNEKDSWQKALRIEQWVHKHLKNKNYSEAFATADQVARTLEGDCTEHAVLAAAMCRASGVPARTAVGLVYVRQDRSMCYHMWMEVWIAGKWYGLDPTLGLGRVGVGHLKIADHHWNDTRSFMPLLPVTRILGKVQIEVVLEKQD